MKSDVSVDIYNTKGERIKQLYKGSVSPDKYSFAWNGIDDNGSFVSSGVYYVVLTNVTSNKGRRQLFNIMHKAKYYITRYGTKSTNTCCRDYSTHNGQGN